jgi:hypothetical protein
MRSRLRQDDVAGSVDFGGRGREIDVENTEFRPTLFEFGAVPRAAEALVKFLLSHYRELAAFEDRSALVWGHLIVKCFDEHDQVVHDWTIDPMGDELGDVTLEIKRPGFEAEAVRILEGLGLRDQAEQIRQWAELLKAGLSEQGKAAEGGDQPVGPWSRIPEGQDRDLARLWNDGLTAPKIGVKLGLDAGSVHNIKSRLRKDYGDEVLPLRNHGAAKRMRLRENKS